MRSLPLLAGLALVWGAVGCQSTGVDPDVAFTLASSPEHVNRVIPGSRPLILVTAESDSTAPIALSGTASVEGIPISIEPATIAAGDVAEVWATVPVVAEEIAVTITVSGRRGTVERQLAFEASLVPGEDDLFATATDIAAVFLDELQGDVSGLPADPTGLTSGTPVAGLLVVSHYAWFTPEYEIGLGWHIMIAPDDFAELYLRPRDALSPSQAFRLDSWSTALAGGAHTITEIPTPAAVTR